MKRLLLSLIAVFTLAVAISANADEYSQTIENFKSSSEKK